MQRTTEGRSSERCELSLGHFSFGAIWTLGFRLLLPWARYAGFLWRAISQAYQPRIWAGAACSAREHDGTLRAALRGPIRERKQRECLYESGLPQPQHRKGGVRGK